MLRTNSRNKNEVLEKKIIYRTTVLSRIKIIVKKFEWYRVQQLVMDDVVVKWNSRCILREVEIA